MGTASLNYGHHVICSYDGCERTAFAVVAGEEGYAVCFFHFCERIETAEPCGDIDRYAFGDDNHIHCFFCEGKVYALPFLSRLVIGNSKQVENELEKLK